MPANGAGSFQTIVRASGNSAFSTTEVIWLRYSDVANQRPLINGGSLIAGPLGELLAGPMEGGIGLLCAEIDRGTLAGARYDLDVTGHYARPDIFTLTVDERPKPGVERIGP